MLILIHRNWRLYVLRGVLAILFGLAALFWPGMTLGVLVILFGAYVTLEGILAIVAALQHGIRDSWLVFLEGIAGVVVGLITFFWPAVTAVALLVLIAVWAIVTGILEIAAAVQLRREIVGEWVLIMTGGLSILIGILLIANPGAGILAVIVLIGVYAILFGALLIYLGVKVRSHEIQ